MKQHDRPFAVALCAVMAAAVIVGCHPRSGRGADAGGGASDAHDALYVDMRPSSGLDFVIKENQRPFTIRESLGQGAGLIDYDQDGLLDIVMLGPDTVKIYHNDGNWHFTDVTAQMGIRQKGFWQGVAVGDYDNDGYPDLYLCGYGCSALYHNEQGHGFKEVTHTAGLDSLPPDAKGNADWRSSAAFVDVNRDGLLDLYVGRYCEFGPNTIHLCGRGGAKASCTPEMYKPQKGILYINKGHGLFHDETKERGLDAASGRLIGIAVADYNDDGWIDLALANDELPGNLFVNKGNGYFREVGKQSGTSYDGSGRVQGGMGIDWGDFDNDGKLDLCITTYEGETKDLFHNMGNGIFIEASELAGMDALTNRWVGWGVKFLDYDNDGWQDLCMTNGHVMDNVHDLGRGGMFRQPLMLLHNSANNTFADVSHHGGAVFETPIAGRALCIGDLDNDGKTDLLITNLDGQPLLLKNTSANANHWIGFNLAGTASNRMGLGSKVSVDAGKLKLTRICTTTGSVLSAHDPRVLVGIGANTLAQSITIRWPSGKTDTYANVAADQYYTATEGAKKLVPISTTAHPVIGAQASR